jgi:tubulin polyglutamylase TTLL6/13
LIAKKTFAWKICENREDTESDVVWTDSAVPPEKLAKMKPYQKINHFPGMYTLARKNYLARNLGKMRKVLPDEFDFFPLTWVLPAELAELKAFAQKNPRCTFILKPEASCQGRGIFLTRSLEEISAADHFVAQRYVDRPLLLDGLKFDLRVYVLVAGCSPLRVYLHEEGLVRLATEQYTAPNGSNLTSTCMHLTNYAVNKLHPAFIFNQNSEADDIGHKRSLKSTYLQLQSLGHDVATLRQEISSLIIKTLTSVQPILAHLYRSCQPEDLENACCFEILGFDILVDQSLKPWLLEVNHSPSFTVDTPLDKRVKRRVIEDALRLMHISCKLKQSYWLRKKFELDRKALQRSTKVSKEEKLAAVQRIQRARDSWESKHCGGYVRLHVRETEECLETAAKVWEEWTGGKLHRQKRAEEARKEDKKPPKRHVKRPSKPPAEKSPQRSHSLTNSPPPAPDKPPAAVFQRLSKVKFTHQRESTPSLPQIYLAEEVPSGITYISPERLYRPVDPPIKFQLHRFPGVKERKQLEVSGLRNRERRREVLIRAPQALDTTQSGAFIAPKVLDFSPFRSTVHVRRQGSDFGFFEGRRPKRV